MVGPRAPVSHDIKEAIFLGIWGPHTAPNMAGPQSHAGNTDRCPFRPQPGLWWFDFAG